MFGSLEAMHRVKFVLIRCILVVASAWLVLSLPSDKAHAVPDSYQGIWHKIRPGDTVWDIGKLYGVPYRRILEANKLSNPKRLQVGKRLFIPGAQAPHVSKSIVHVVERGDTLWDLARKYHVRVRDIQRANPNLSAEHLWVGRRIVIPNVAQRYRFGKPLTGTLIITSNYGYRIHPISKKRRFHHGVDLRAKVGSYALAADDGEVIFVGYYYGYGKTVMLKHKNGYITRYGHLSRILVPHGRKVRRGEPIGRTGDTGYSTGPHLHFEVRKGDRTVDPMLYLQG